VVRAYTQQPRDLLHRGGQRKGGQRRVGGMTPDVHRAVADQDAGDRLRHIAGPRSHLRRAGRDRGRGREQVFRALGSGCLPAHGKADRDADTRTVVHLVGGPVDELDALGRENRGKQALRLRPGEQRQVDLLLVGCADGGGDHA